MANHSTAAVDPEQGRANRRTAWILASIALVFFVGVFVRHWLV